MVIPYTLPYIANDIIIYTISSYITLLHISLHLITLSSFHSIISSLLYVLLSAEKIALRLQGSSEYSNDTKEFLINCCDFHGCNNMKFYSGCHRLYKAGGIDDDDDYNNDVGNYMIMM